MPDANYAGASPEARVDPEHPWLGLQPFTERTQSYFFGRTEEIREMFLLVHEHPLTVLFGQSGLGKTSLLRAGLIPKLRVENYRPVHMLLDFSESAASLVDQVRLGVAVAVANNELAAEDWLERWGRLETLWEIFAHLELRPEKLGSRPLVLIFDQFEEVFTFGWQDAALDGVDSHRNRRPKGELRDLIHQLADLIEHRPPLVLQEGFRTDRARARLYDFHPISVHVVLALREDFLSHLEAWKSVLPSLMRNRLPLRLLTGPQALEAVVRPGHIGERSLISDEVGAAIVRQVAKRDEYVPLEQIEAVPPLVSLLCERLNATRLAANPPLDHISAQLVADQSEDILQRFYEESFDLFPEAIRLAVRAFVEEDLLTVGGHRKPVPREDAMDALAKRGVEPRGVIDHLLSRRLLTSEHRGGLPCIEITHDVLAPLVLFSRNARQKDLADKRAKDERLEAEAHAEAKAASEFLAAKVRFFERTMIPLTAVELVYLYRHRQKIQPTERELRVLLASMLHNIEEGARNESPGAYWFSAASADDFLRWFIQIEHWAAKERSSLRPSHEWVKTFPVCGLESQFSVLATDIVPSIRAICAQWIGRAERDEALPLLRDLGRDPDRDVRRAALEALGKFSKEGALPLLRELVKDPNWEVQHAALEVLAMFSREEALPLLRELTEDRYRDEGRTALKALASLSKEEEDGLTVLRQIVFNDREPAVRRLTAVEALASFSKEEALPLLRKLARDQNWAVRSAAMKALANFSKKEDLPLLSELDNETSWEVWVKNALQYSVTKHEYWDMGLLGMKTLGNFSKEEDLPLLRELVKNQYSGMRLVAMKALAGFSKEEDLPLLREQANDWNSGVRLAAAEALASFSKEEALPVLRKLAKDQYRGVRFAAVEALASFSEEEDLPPLREMVQDRDSGVRLAGLKALASFLKEEDIPLLRELVKDRDWDVRLTALEALASFSKEEDIPLLRELAMDPDWDMRLAVVNALATFSKEGALPLLHELVKDLNWDVRAAALKALASFSKEAALPLLRELVNDLNWEVRAAALKVLTSFSKEEDIPLLRELTKSQYWDVRAAALKALENFTKEEDALPLLREMANDPHLGVRTAALTALTSFSKGGALPLLRELVRDLNCEVRAAATKALASFSKEEALPPLRELALVADDTVSTEAARHLASLCSREELETFLNQHDQKLCARALTALDHLLYMPVWLQAEE